MAGIIQLKRSSVSGRVPDAANVEVGEPVVNLADQILFTKDGSGTVKVIGAGVTSNIAEGTNLYFTNARVVSAVETNSLGNANIGNLFVGTHLTVGNLQSTGYRFPSADGVALQILQTDGNGQLSFVNLDAASGGGFSNSTLIEFPGHDANVDYGADETFVGQNATGLSDAFGVSLGAVYDCMEPIGRMVNEDLSTIT